MEGLYQFGLSVVSGGCREVLVEALMMVIMTNDHNSQRPTTHSKNSYCKCSIISHLAIIGFTCYKISLSFCSYLQEPVELLMM